MKRVIALFATLILLIGLCAVPVLALGIGPPSVEFDVPAEGSTDVEFLVYDFTGDLEVSLEDIPLRVEPTTVPVIAKEGGTRVVLTFYGDVSFGSQVFNGKIRFLAMTGGNVAMGIKVKATVNHIVAGQPLLTLEETSPVSTLATTPTLSATTTSIITVTVTPLPEAPSQSNEWIIPAGIIAGVAILIAIVFMVFRRRRY